jgi:hypothetical protein
MAVAGVFEAVDSSIPCKAQARIVRFALRITVAVSGAVIGLQALLGPLTFPLKVTKPVNPEDWFALALLTMLVTADATKNLARKSLPPI